LISGDPHANQAPRSILGTEQRVAGADLVERHVYLSP